MHHSWNWLFPLFPFFIIIILLFFGRLGFFLVHFDNRFPPMSGQVGGIGTVIRPQLMRGNNIIGIIKSPPFQTWAATSNGDVGGESDSMRSIRP